MLARLRALREWLLRRNRCLAMHCDRVSRGLAGGTWAAFCASIAALKPGRLWRYAQAGDLPGSGASIDRDLLQMLVRPMPVSGSSRSPTSRCSAMILLLPKTGV
jgi:hypothetical protein